jgi:hypothetical protein
VLPRELRHELALLPRARAMASILGWRRQSE